MKRDEDNEIIILIEGERQTRGSRAGRSFFPRHVNQFFLSSVLINNRLTSPSDQNKGKPLEPIPSDLITDSNSAVTLDRVSSRQTRQRCTKLRDVLSQQANCSSSPPGTEKICCGVPLTARAPRKSLPKEVEFEESCIYCSA